MVADHRCPSLREVGRERTGFAAEDGGAHRVGYQRDLAAEALQRSGQVGSRGHERVGQAHQHGFVLRPIPGTTERGRRPVVDEVVHDAEAGGLEPASVIEERLRRKLHHDQACVRANSIGKAGGIELGQPVLLEVRVDEAQSQVVGLGGPVDRHVCHVIAATQQRDGQLRPPAAAAHIVQRDRRENHRCRAVDRVAPVVGCSGGSDRQHDQAVPGSPYPGEQPRQRVIARRSATHFPPRRSPQRDRPWRQHGFGTGPPRLGRGALTEYHRVDRGVGQIGDQVSRHDAGFEAGGHCHHEVVLAELWRSGAAVRHDELGLGSAGRRAADPVRVGQRRQPADLCQSRAGDHVDVQPHLTGLSPATHCVGPTRR